jgi:hypothetical protein
MPRRYRESSVIAPLGLSLGAKRGRVVNVTLWLLCPGRELRYPLKWRLSGPHSPEAIGNAFMVFNVEIMYSM